jgi:subtilisin family serine protease
MPPILLAFALVWLALAPVTLAQSKKPLVPPGRDPGGVAVALLSGGVDYTHPQLAARLARDGEGELIGWDVEDRDRQPFGNGLGTAAALTLLGPGDVRLVAVRINPADPVSLGRAIAFVAQTPARVAALATSSLARDGWEPLRQAALHFKAVLVIVPAQEGASAMPPTLLGLDNVLGVGPLAASGEDALQQAVAAAARAAALLIAREPKLDAAALKHRLAEGAGDARWRAHR